MFSLKTTVLLSAPLLAAASDIVPNRIQRRAALLELLRHDHERRAENYGVQDVCTATPGDNQASWLSIAPNTVFAAPLQTYTYPVTSGDCITLSSCESACVVDGAECLGVVYTQTPSSCTLLGNSYGGATLAAAPAAGETFLLQNAGTTSASSGSSSGETVPTCATAGTLDTQDANGRCNCGIGRHQASAYTCEADPVPAGTIDPAKPVKTLDQPVGFVSPITWSNDEKAVPAVMTGDQCATICAADGNCEAFLVAVGSELSSCYKIGGNGVYPSPAGFPIEVTTSTRKVRRQAGGVSGNVGGPGDIFGQTSSSTLINNAYAAATGGTRMRVKRAHQSQAQW